MTEERHPHVIRWDPRAMISGPFTECPKCHRHEFGTASVDGRSWMRQCRGCLYSQAERLPELRKKLIYLDQMVISNIAKALDPKWQQERQRDDAFWLELFDQLERLIKMHLIVCPQSPIHERESSVHAYAEPMRRLYEHLACGVRLRSPSEVIRWQLHQVLEDPASGGPDRATVDGTGILSGSRTEWMDRTSISFRYPVVQATIEERRESRDRLGDAFAALWPMWAREDIDFEKRFAIERRGLYEVWLKRYNEWVAQHALATQTGVLTEDIINPRAEIGIVRGLLGQVQQSVPGGEVGDRLVAFLFSEPALSVPANEIAALLIAGLAGKAASGQRKVPSGGTMNDMNAIASYLPYCDAMFIDDYFASLMQDQPLKSRLAQYRTRVFSNRTREEFLSYLADIEASAPSEHVALVRRVYGDDWLMPYRRMLADDRARRANHTD